MTDPRSGHDERAGGLLRGGRRHTVTHCAECDGPKNGFHQMHPDGTCERCGSRLKMRDYDRRQDGGPPMRAHRERRFRKRRGGDCSRVRATVARRKADR